jgi:hypothetical protein
MFICPTAAVVFRALTVTNSDNDSAHFHVHAANVRNEQLIIDCSKTRRMSSKKTAKIVVKSEVTTVTPKKRKRGKESDGDGSDAEDNDVQIPLASAVKTEKKSEVKSEVKSEMIAKKRKRGDGDEDEDAKDAISDRMNDEEVRKKKKKKKRAKRHACTEPECGKDFDSPSAVLSIFEGIRVKSHFCVLNQAAERHLRRRVI